tara:strand:- start:102 stop:704 length:603 start_codon:yes stop_codon:yes gene_type:complete
MGRAKPHGPNYDYDCGIGCDCANNGEIWKPAVYKDAVIQGYTVSDHGRVGKTDGSLHTHTITQRDGYCMVTLRLPIDTIIDGYSYGMWEKRQAPNSKSAALKVNIHTLVMHTFRPFNDYPTFDREVWASTPDEVKLHVRNTIQIDHIDANKRNNHIWNLRYVTARENYYSRKVEDGVGIEGHEVDYDKSGAIGNLERFMQ